MMEGIKPHGHELDKLFDKLSKDTKNLLSKEYEQLGGNERKDTLYIRCALNGTKPEKPTQQPARGVKLDQLLKNNNDIFVDYRYMYENGRSNKWEYFYFEHGNLYLAVRSLKKIASKFLDNERGKSRAQ